MSKKTTEEFFNSYPSKTYKTGKVFIRPGDILNTIFYIVSGNVRMYSISESGEEATLHIFKPKTFFPIMLIFAASANDYFFESTTDVEIKKVPTEQVLHFLNENPDELFLLTKSFAHGLVGFSKRIETLLFQNSNTKVSSLLLYLSKKYGEKEKNSEHIKLKITHQEISSWLGVARETVSRQIELLEKEKIVRYQGNILEIIDLKRLKVKATV